MSCIFVPCGGRRLRVLLSHVSASSSSSSSSSDVRSRVTPAEWRLREDLAAAYHIAAQKGWDELVYNHITVRVNDDDDSDDAAGTRPPEFLINPFGLSFAEVTASSLVKIDLEGRVVDPGSTGRPVNVAGFVIHSAVHAARDDLHCVWHTHHSPTVAVSAMKAGFLPLSQEACIIMPRMSAKTHPFEGIAVDTGERERIVAALDGKRIFLRNKRSTVYVGGASSDIEATAAASFRNPPKFMSFTESRARDAEYETEALLDHLFYHPNTAPFISHLLIQRMVTSNPSPRYVEAVARAFMAGTHDATGIGSGEYGDLKAAVAAILLDPEARAA
eukprot:g6557.t1